MTKLSGKDLQALYPKRKTYDEIQADKIKLAAKRTPKHAELKISAWTTTWLVTVVTTYALIYKIMSISLDSSGGVIFGVCVSVLLLLVALGGMYYLCSLISSVAQKLLATPTVLYTILITIIGVVLLLFDVMSKSELLNLFTVIGLMSFHAVSVYIVTRTLIKAGRG